MLAMVSEVNGKQLPRHYIHPYCEQRLTCIVRRINIWSSILNIHRLSSLIKRLSITISILVGFTYQMQSNAIHESYMGYKRKRRHEAIKITCVCANVSWSVCVRTHVGFANTCTKPQQHITNPESCTRFGGCSLQPHAICYDIIGIIQKFVLQKWFDIMDK